METNRRNALKLSAAVAASVLSIPPAAAEDEETERLYKVWRKAYEDWLGFVTIFTDIERKYVRERPPHPELLMSRNAVTGEIWPMFRDGIEKQYRAECRADPSTAAMRRSERLAALEQWEREKKAVALRTGLVAAEARLTRLGDIVDAAFQQLMARRSRTLRGIALKLVAADLCAGEWNYCGEHVSMVVSAIADANRLLGQTTS